MKRILIAVIFMSMMASAFMFTSSCTNPASTFPQAESTIVAYYPSFTPLNTATVTSTNTATSTATMTPTGTATQTPTNTATDTP